jgi:transitional endoplasmic reticulum ATPase
MWKINKPTGKLNKLDFQAGQPMWVEVKGNSLKLVYLPQEFLNQFDEEDGISVDNPLHKNWSWKLDKGCPNSDRTIIQDALEACVGEWRGRWVSKDALKELEDAVVWANALVLPTEPWRLIEVEHPDRNYEALEVQPHMVMVSDNSGMILMPREFLKGFDKDCPLEIGHVDPSPLRLGEYAFNAALCYNTKISNGVWRAWNYTDHSIVRAQIREALAYWYAHNQAPELAELDKLLAEATTMCEASTPTAGALVPSTKGDLDMSVKEPATKKNADIEWENRRSIALPGTPAWPVNMPPEEAAKLLLDKAKEDNEEMSIVEDIADCFPWDGAVQFSRAMAELHGWGRVKATETMFGKRPPASVAVEVEPGKFEEVIWGEFSIPGIKGELSCGIGRKDKRMIFSIQGTVIKRDLPLVRKLADLTRKLVRTSSIYRGKAIQLVLQDNGAINWAEQPRFLNAPVHMSDLIYSEEILDQIGTHLIAPVVKRDMLAQIGRPFGGAVLISGTYGVGKTVLAAALSNVCREAGVTFIDVKSLAAVQDALVAARPLGPALVFVEDIDRISADAERNEKTQEIMNTIASVSSKGAEVMAVFTTNRPGAIAPGLVQRFSGVIVIDPPKAPEVERLIRLYGCDLVEPSEDLAEAAEHLAGKVPRTIEQIVQASKQYAVHRNNVDDIRAIRIIGRDIIGAAIQKEFQLQLESRCDERILSPAEKAGKALAELFQVDKISAIMEWVEERG